MAASSSHAMFEAGATPVGAHLPIGGISDRGAYVCHWSGHLLRVADAAAPGRAPLLGLRANQPLFVTKISTNPFVTISEARMLAADFDLSICF